MTIPAARRRVRSGVLLAGIVLACLASLVFIHRSYGSWLLLRSAFAAGAPLTSAIRPWMTVRYVATTYRIPASQLSQALGIAPEQDLLTIKAAADAKGERPLEYAGRVQRAVAALGGPRVAPADGEGWSAALEVEVLGALQRYGYVVLAAGLLLGAVGLPLPNGMATVLSGSLAAQGQMHWAAVAATAMLASVVGDFIAYGAGRFFAGNALRHHLRWLGYSAARQDRAKALFERWGALSILVTRTFASYLSPPASLAAGTSRYPASTFVAVSFLGRALWTGAYVGLGYLAGTQVQAASSFLGNVAGVVVSAACAAIVIGWARQDRRQRGHARQAGA